MEALEALERVLGVTMLQLDVPVADLEGAWQRLPQQRQMVELVELPWVHLHLEVKRLEDWLAEEMVELAQIRLLTLQSQVAQEQVEVRQSLLVSMVETVAMEVFMVLPAVAAEQDSMPQTILVLAAMEQMEL
jgi:hypothetical protein